MACLARLGVALPARAQGPDPAPPDPAASAPQRVEINAAAPDSTVGEILKRLPGVTVSGRPGRGGAPRMRGLGNGYTQILVDGERMPRGFSLDSIEPDQIERIEILRAPTAETGARAIAGTINIVMREDFRRQQNDLRVSLGSDAKGTPTLEQWLRARGQSWRHGVFVRSRLRWREAGDSLELQPYLTTSDSHGSSLSTLQQTLGSAQTQDTLARTVLVVNLRLELKF